jgi:hypothetical protein
MRIFPPTLSLLLKVLWPGYPGELGGGGGRGIAEGKKWGIYKLGTAIEWELKGR